MRPAADLTLNKLAFIVIDRSRAFGTASDRQLPAKAKGGFSKTAVYLWVVWNSCFGPWIQPAEDRHIARLPRY
ncbi:MAG: hypothetical protein CFE44_13795 [Burkholderiales bacterium PBB4]|nr:MAG: hypothetical protein CFE44_13795 [Burkholderiales bacterium PBB4]